MKIRIAVLIASCATFAMAGQNQISPIPEPGTLILMGVGLTGLAVYARKRTKR